MRKTVRKPAKKTASTKLDKVEFDRLCELAKDRGMNLSNFVKEAILKEMKAATADA